MTPPDDIYLSVVVTSRNDNHGGKIMARMRHCFASLSEQAARYQLPIQLLLVDWNPPADRPSLADIPEFPASHEFFRFDVLTVPHEVHAALPCADQIPLFQYYAKNAGIRRALGEYVLATNVDVIFADALAAYLAKRPLRRGLMYRNDRWDTNIGDLLDGLTDESRQEACMRNVVQINVRHGTLMTSQLGPEAIGHILVDDLPAKLEHFIDDLQQTLAVESPHQLTLPALTACGDFQLLAREDWFRLRGYAEVPIHSWHIDSLFAYQALAAGFKEEMLPSRCPVYHIHHAPGWANQGTIEGGLDVSLERGDKDFRLTIKGRDMPLLVSDEVDRFIEGIGRAPNAVVNGRDWGYADTALEMVTRA